LLESFCQDAFDAVDAHGNRRARKPGDLANAGRVDFFEVENDDLAVERTQLLNQRLELTEIRFLALSCFWGRDFKIIKAEEGRMGSALTKNVRSGYVVRDTISPGAERTMSIKVSEHPPKLEGNLLAEIETLVGVCFVSSSEPSKRMPERGSCLSEEVFLI